LRKGTKFVKKNTEPSWYKTLFQLGNQSTIIFFTIITNTQFCQTFHKIIVIHFDNNSLKNIVEHLGNLNPKFVVELLEPIDHHRSSHRWNQSSF